MSIVVASDLGKPVMRNFERLTTASDQFFGSTVNGGYPMVWVVDNNMAIRMGVVNALNSDNCHFNISPGQSVLEVALEQLPLIYQNLAEAEWRVEPFNIPPGKYFPRIARPNHQHPGDFPSQIPPNGWPHEKAAAMLQAESLCERLENAFRTIDPDPQNMNSFGGEFRNILILAATEFEAQCKGILRANEYSNGGGNNWNTKDYVKLEPALRLADYSLSLARYPWIDPITPFKNWTANAPTQSLGWYDAYNAVKHDREKSFAQASLTNAIQSVTAVVAICLAEFGIDFLRQSSLLRDIFAVRERPSWSIGDTHGQVSGLGRIEPIFYPFD